MESFGRSTVRGWAGAEDAGARRCPGLGWCALEVKGALSCRVGGVASPSAPWGHIAAQIEAATVKRFGHRPVVGMAPRRLAAAVVAQAGLMSTNPSPVALEV